jgi:MYXO-CTERM domain-containing protein
MNTSIKTAIALVALAGFSSGVKAGSFNLYDDTFSILINGAAATGSLEATWGTFSAGVFTPLAGIDSGYADLAGPELSAGFSGPDNTVFAVNVSPALAILSAADGTAYSASIPQIVLTDSSWVVSTFTLTGPDLAFELSAGTVANQVNGVPSSFTFGATGNDTITIGIIPEPSTFTALAGVAVLGLAALRRRRA